MSDELGSPMGHSNSSGVPPEVSFIADRPPLPLRCALWALLRCAITTIVLLASRALKMGVGGSVG